MELYFNATSEVASTIKSGASSHKLSDYNARILDIEHTPPTPIYHLVEIEGRHDVVDFTEYDGKVDYKNDRKTVITFDIPEDVETTVNVNALTSLVHGKSFYFVLGENSTKVYKARFKIEKAKTQNINYCTYTLTLNYLDYLSMGGEL